MCNALVTCIAGFQLFDFRSWGGKSIPVEIYLIRTRTITKIIFGPIHRELSNWRLRLEQVWFGSAQDAQAQLAISIRRNVVGREPIGEKYCKHFPTSDHSHSRFLYSNVFSIILHINRWCRCKRGHPEAVAALQRNIESCLATRTLEGRLGHVPKAGIGMLRNIGLSKQKTQK